MINDMDGALGSSGIGSNQRAPGSRGRLSLLKVGAVLAVLLSLFLFGVAFVERSSDKGVTIRTVGGPLAVTIAMRLGAPSDQVAAISDRLHTNPDVKSFTFCDQACAYAEFKGLFNDSPEFKASVQASDLPATFRVVPTRPDLGSPIADELRREPGVEQSVYPMNVSDLAAVANRVEPHTSGRDEWLYLGFAVVCLAGAVLLGARSFNRRA